MPIKSILCVYSGEAYEAAALEAAFRLASRCRAELRILHPTPPVVAFPDLYGADVASLEREGLERAARAEQCARDMAEKTQLAFRCEDEQGEDELPCAIFTAAEGYADDVVPAFGRACDLVIIGRDDTEVSGDIDTILAALLDTCTPALVVPRQTIKAAIKFADPGQTVALAWDGSAAAGRALRCLELVLNEGQKIEIICVRSKGGKAGLCPPSAATRWLGLHGFAAHVSQSGPFAMSDGEAILVNARHAGADLLVMGAYGHDHWREMLIGGATDHILKNGRLPLLLCH